jgi:NAD(P)-dependent dehydrogenase (short-subunit alcohol dehydrogenase family)
MTTPLEGKTALITGAASGIGRQLARLLARCGMSIAAIDLDAAGLDSLAAEIGPACAVTRADVTDLPALRSAVRGLEEKLGAVEMLVASAGIGRGTPADRFRAEEVNAILSVNLIGVVNSIDAVLAGMRKRKSGHIVVLSSLAGTRGVPLMSAYSASKAGCNALCDALRVELAPEGIAVTTVAPGWIRTPMTEALGLPRKMLMPLEDAARIILDAIRRRKASVAFPRLLAVQVWLMRFLPRPVGDWMAGMLMRRARKLFSPRPS